MSRHPHAMARWKPWRKSSGRVPETPEADLKELPSPPPDGGDTRPGTATNEEAHYAENKSRILKKG
jgi:hypothetical protein